MHHLKIYFDTSVVGFSSDLTIDEINSLQSIDKRNEILKFVSSLNILKIDEEVVQLAENYLEYAILSRKSIEDCLHIAISTIHEIDILVSWNFKHIVNINKIPKFNLVNLSKGYKQIQICSPMELHYAFE